MASSNSSNNEYDLFGSSTITAKLYLKGELADVHFLVKDDGGKTESIPAHKIILAAGSDGFHRMFYGELKEKGDVKIVDASAAAFKEFLQYFYMNKVKLTMENVAEVIYLSDKYHVDMCKAACVDLLQRSPTVENACEVFQLAILFNQAELKKTYDKFIVDNTVKVLKSDGFLECKKNILEHILCSELLSCPETVLFEACMAWVKKASQQDYVTKELIQTHMGDLFKQFRFRSMDFVEFSSLLPLYEHLFSAGELSEILQMIENEHFQPKFFNAIRRESPFKWKKNEKIVYHRMSPNGFNICYDLKDVETTTFSTKKLLLLGGFRSYVRFSPAMAPAEITIQRMGGQQPTVLRQFNLNFTNGRVDLPKPVLIRPDIEHEIQLKMKLPRKTYYTQNSLMTEVDTASNIVIWFSNDQKQNGRTTGLITTLYFNSV